MMPPSLIGLLGLAALSSAAPALPHLSTHANHHSAVHSLSLPGFQFRRVEPLVSISSSKKVQNHLCLRRLSTGKPRRSAAAVFGQVQRDNDGGRYENVTAVNHYAVEYAVSAIFNGIPMTIVVDSGSADTWIRGFNFTCRNGLNQTIPSEACGLGPPFTGDFVGGPLEDEHFTIAYGDGENIQGRVGYMDVEFAGIMVAGQEIALASQGTWLGNGVSSGVLGLAYPSLTSAYMGDDLDADAQYLSVPYSPLFTSMVSDGLIEPYWTLAMARNSSLGSISLGGMPPVNLSHSNYDSTPILIAEIIDKEKTAWQPSFYTIVPKGFHFGQETTTLEYPFILDTATSLIYLPYNLAEAVNGQFDPPAKYSYYYDSYFTKCDAIPPRFGVQIEGTTFWVNSQDLLNKEVKDPDTGYCQTGISDGGEGPFILGAVFLTNVVVSMNIGSGRVEFWSHELY
ncbi:acid protease [Hypoxylon sp. FL1284]|nr:acid protease [Hypoxylon sp. FL1284]